jgi:putative CocE/NonD family hydrolase
MGSEPDYGVVVAKDVMVPMRDGVRLATDVYRPARVGEPAPGRFPAILGRTSYDKSSPRMWVEPVGMFFARHGYVSVVQDLRGRHRSEGTGQYYHTANPDEGKDGYDTASWIGEQPWSNGRVGTVGSSHGAIVQAVMALYRPPNLAAMWQDVGPTNMYAHCSREGGAMALHMFGALFLHGHDAQEISDDPAAVKAFADAMERMRELVYATPFRPGDTPLAAVPNLEKVLFDYYHRGEYDEFWQQDCCDQERHFERHGDIPSVFSGGWYDPFAGATTGYFTAMSKQNRTPQRLLMGPWNHGGIRGEGDSFAGDVDFGPDAAWGDDVYNRERLRWFDRWLKEFANAVDDDPPVRIFVMGGGDGRRNADGRLNHGGTWRSEREWPLERTVYTPYYLRDGGRLSVEIPTEGEIRADYRHDPDNPVPTIAGNVTGFYELVPLGDGMVERYTPPRARMRSIVLDGAAHQQEAPGIVGAAPPYPLLASRDDVLVFQTGPLAEDVEVTGPIAVNLWIASTAVDTDFTAKLIDVYPASEDDPAGYHMNLVDSIIRTRYRNGWEQAEMMTPGDVYAVKIDLPPTSNLFKRRHRIRVDISSSNFPRFDVNPNTGEPVGRHTYSVIARNTVYMGLERPSHIVLPIIPLAEGSKT